MIEGLLAAVGFLTRMPVPGAVFARPGAQARSLPWYPAVGLLVGAVLSALAWCLRDAAPLLAAAVLLSSWVWLTGALHIDGLADTADAWVGGMGDRTRTLAIMKDPSSGPMAVTAVVLILLLKCAALAALLPTAPGVVWLAPLLGRTALVAAFSTTPYVRAGGCAMAFDTPVAPSAPLHLRQLSGGLHAVVRHVGNYAELEDALDHILACWLPDSGYTRREAPLHSLYLDDPETVAEAELRADIRVPVQRSGEAASPR